ncbi:phospholipase D-like domain-containing protein [Rhodovarius lipocyclicus]|uniref:phospholipase D-like domain-containing protein n=1 Tax=Rhodovarius lipocyclicus TaxID=268410 RepID=UPI001356C17F|nr:phospholipase D-like domain-containing protein [Rhodovarius lipocyclicus]
MTGPNLNETPLPGTLGERFRDRPSNLDRGMVACVFRDIEGALVEQISRWPVVIGCVAWLTNPAVLRALSTREAVSLVVQKEDFLRPDAGNWSAGQTRAAYERLPGTSRYNFAGVCDLSFASDDRLPPVVCAGVHAQRSAIPPRMHHKFFVFGSFDHTRSCNPTFVPAEVWTGSFNPTVNGTRSLENAVIIRDAEIATAYEAEWANVVTISEPLDWTAEYVDPQWRVGT